MGKTALLREFDSRAIEAGWFTTFEELSSKDEFSKIIALVARHLLLEMSASRRFGDRLKRAASVLKAFSVAFAPGLRLEFDVEPATGTADSGVLRRDVAELFVELGEVAQSAGSGALIIFDELHTRRKDGGLDLLDLALHQVAQRGLPVTMVGAGLFPGAWVDSEESDQSEPEISTYAGRMYRLLRLRLLSLDDAIAALVAPAEEQGVTYEAGAARAAATFVGGHPWFLHLIGEAAWETATARNVIKTADVEEACRLTKARLRADFFPQLLRGLPKLATSVLARLSSFGPQSIGQLHTRLTEDPNELWDAVRLLLDREIVEVVRSPGGHGGLSINDDIGIAIPLLDAFASERLRDEPS